MDAHAIHEHVLVVEGAHAPMMQHVAPTIIERVNRFFGYPAVDRIMFRQGIVQAEKARSRPAPASLRPIPAELGDSLREVVDPELRVRGVAGLRVADASVFPAALNSQIHAACVAIGERAAELLS